MKTDNTTASAHTGEKYISPTAIASTTILPYRLLSLATIVFASFIAFWYAHQLPLELHSFRQTQTALTSFWFMKEGFKFAYQTPIAGAPWSIPFEFPLYQYLAAITAQIFRVDLVAAGRVLSFVFLLLCLPPTAAICKRLLLPKATVYVFASLLLSCPLYLYWGRTFMMETAAVFLAITAIYYFIAYVQERSARSIALFVIFISLSALQKATTALPVLAVLAFALLIFEAMSSGLRKTFSIKNITHALFLFAIPLAICVAWTTYTDTVKLQNAFGASLTSSSLSQWNWGTLEQRLSETLYVSVIWDRVFKDSLAGILGVAILLWGLVTAPSRGKAIITTSLVLGIAPFFIFTNLHIVHTYYQTANVIFLLFAISVSISETLDSRLKLIATCALIATIAINYSNFHNGYYRSVVQNFSSDERDILVSSAIKSGTQADEGTIIFGNDWSSTIAFLSERKSFTAPEWFSKYDSILSNPEHYMGDLPLGAVVLCPGVKHPTPVELQDWASQRNWKVIQAGVCQIALRT